MDAAMLPQTWHFFELALNKKNYNFINHNQRNNKNYFPTPAPKREIQTTNK